MPARTTITTRLLRRHNACDSQVELFRDTFGAEAKLTPANIRKAIAVGLQTLWLPRLLKGENYYAYTKASEELPEWKKWNRIVCARDNAERKIWEAYYKADNQIPFGSSERYTLRNKRDAKIQKLDNKYRQQTTDAKTALTAAQGKLILKFLRKA